MLNKVMLIGRLGQDPELKYFSSGSPYVKLSVATDESYLDRDGNKVERTEWHNVMVYQRQAENCASYLSKGSRVYVEGSLQTRKWEDKEGNPRYTTEVRAQRVQFLDRKGERQSGEGWSPPREETAAEQPRSQARQGQSQKGSPRKQAGRNGDYGNNDGEGNDGGDYVGGGSEALTDEVPF